jgi:hypothetical protein
MLVEEELPIGKEALCVWAGHMESIVYLLFLMPFVEEVCCMACYFMGVSYALASFF